MLMEDLLGEEFYLLKQFQYWVWQALYFNYGGGCSVGLLVFVWGILFYFVFSSEISSCIRVYE